MPDSLTMPQPHHTLPLRPGKESASNKMASSGFPEHLKHTDILGDSNRLKLTASNSLFHAVLKGRVRTTENLLDRGTAVNGRNDYGFSVLTAALHVDDDKRRERMFRLLLSRGADPHFIDLASDRTVLHWACLLARTQQVEVLLKEAGCDLDLRAVDKGSHTALHHAVMTGHLPVVKPLVDLHRKFGVSVDIADKMGLTPYLHAKRLGYRDVAGYLHSEGQASQGQGCSQFRTSREWSMIGKFERQQAVHFHTQEAINFAKIQGNIKQIKSLESSIMTSPRHPASSSTLPSPSPTRTRGVRASTRHPDRLSMSLPSLEEHGTLNEPLRPVSANGVAPGHNHGDFDENAPKPPREAFVNNAAPTLSKSHAPRPTLPPLGSQHVTGGMEESWEGVEATQSLPVSHESRGGAALTLMEMNFKGRHASTYRQSQFDKTKASEYQHMLGNLNSIMDVLSQQQSKSFRKSVKYQRPETPKPVKTKSKVSSLALIFGRDKTSRRSKRRSARSTRKAESSAARKKKEKAGEEKKSAKKKAVPLLKVNGKLV